MSENQSARCGRVCRLHSFPVHSLCPILHGLVRQAKVGRQAKGEEGVNGNIIYKAIERTNKTLTRTEGSTH